MSGRKEVLTIAENRDLFQELEPFLNRGTLDVNWVPSGKGSLMLAMSHPYDLILAEYPIKGIEVGGFLEDLRREPSQSRATPVLLVTDGLSNDDLAEHLDGDLVQAFVVGASQHDLQSLICRILRVSARRTERILVQLDVQVEGQRVLRVCQSKDISETGMLLRVSQELPLGSELGISFTLPGDRRAIQGQVQVMRATNPEFEKVRGIGVRFLKLEQDGADRLREFLAKLAD